MSRGLLACCLALLTAGPAWAASPQIDSVLPRSVRPGTRTEITFSGSGLLSATNVHADFPATLISLGEGKFRVDMKPDVPAGIIVVRLLGTNGVSDPSLLLVDEFATVSESKTNKTRQSAQSLALGSAVEGRTEDLSCDWFRVRARKGQRVAIEVVANRLGSRLDSVLRVFDDAGKQLAHNDDAPGLRGDSFIAFKAPRDGDYFVELRDVTYSGSSETFYRVRVGDFALATATFPPAVTRESNAVVHLTGPAGELGRVRIRATNAPVFPVSIRGETGSTFARVLVTDRQEVVEREPNDSAAKATAIAWTNGINGRFERAGDRDFYRFTAAKGDRIEFRAASRSLGAPCDVVLEILSAEGKTLARSNPAAADEGVVTHRFATNGTYFLAVEEATGAFAANCVYRVAGSIAAGFTLSLDTDRFHIAAGKSFDVKVSVTRGDHKGPITLRIEGTGDLIATNNLIADGKTNVTMKVTVPPTLTVAPRFFSIIGEAERDGRMVRVRASTAPALRKQFPQMLYLPPELDGEVALGVVQ